MHRCKTSRGEIGWRGSIPSRAEIQRTMTMANNKDRVISAVFQDRYDAIEAHSFVKSLGYADSEINVLMSDTTRRQFDENKETRHAAGNMGLEGAATGGAIGTAI